MEVTFDRTHVLPAVYLEVQQRFSRVNDLAHGWEHVSRVYKLAQYIAEQEHAEHFIVGMATLMHDLGRTVPEEDSHGNKIHHADSSVILATEILQRHQVPIEQQQAILHAIIAHSFSRGIEPQTVEASIVRDADRLEGIGAIGILRWAMVGEQLRNSQTLSYHPDDPFGETHMLDDRAYMLDHFFLKLLKLAETMLTPTGRQLAQSRTAFLRTYLQELKNELENV